MCRIVFNSQDEWVNAMERFTKYNTKYISKQPFNPITWHGSALGTDSVGFQKTLFNSRNLFSEKEGVELVQTLENTGNCTEYGLISQCSNISTDFKLLKKNEPRILYMQGHIGAYLGKNVSVNGLIYNVLEWTKWPGDFSAGLIYSYIDENGRRLNHRGGRQMLTWEAHGKPTKWVKYVEVSLQVEELEVNGIWDSKMTQVAQTIFGTKIDGIISNQPKSLKKYCTNCLSETWNFTRTGGYSPFIVSLQKWVGAPVNGIFNRNTIRLLQKKLDIKVNGRCDSNTIKAFQIYLNTQHKI